LSSLLPTLAGWPTLHSHLLLQQRHRFNAKFYVDFDRQYGIAFRRLYNK
jgi:hypothetical protein